MANILLNEDYSIRTTKLNQTDIYDISKLLFYIPNTFNNMNVFILLKDSIGMVDIIPLQYSGNQSSYKIYKVNYSNQVRIKSGTVTLSIITFNHKNNSCSISTGNIEFNISVENYKIGHQLAISQELNLYIKDVLEKIMKLTDINIDIYEKITGVTKL